MPEALWLTSGASLPPVNRLLKNDLDRVASSSKAMPGTAVRHQFDERSRTTAQSLSKRSEQEFFSSLLRGAAASRGVLPRPSASAHAEALWKQEGTKCCQFPRNHGYGARRAGRSNWRKCRRNTQTSAIVHGPFDTTHNLKVVGSNPTPATRNTRDIKRLNAALRGGVRASNTRGSIVEARGGEVLHSASQIGAGDPHARQ